MRANVLRFLGLCLLSVALFALTACNNESAGGGVGVINPEKIYEESEAGKAGVAYLNTVGEMMQNELTTLQAKLQEGNGESKEEAAAKFQQGLMALQERFNVAQQHVMNQIQEMYQQSIEECRMQKKLTVIIDVTSTAAHAPSIDITDDVIAIMNQKKVEFPPVMPVDSSELAPAANGNAPASNSTAPASNATVPASNATTPSTNGTPSQ